MRCVHTAATTNNIRAHSALEPRDREKHNKYILKLYTTNTGMRSEDAVASKKRI